MALLAFWLAKKAVFYVSIKSLEVMKFITKSLCKSTKKGSKYQSIVLKFCTYVNSIVVLLVLKVQPDHSANTGVNRDKATC